MTGAEIKALRKANGDKQIYLCLMIGYDQSFYSKVERGEKSAPHEMVKRIKCYYAETR